MRPSIGPRLVLAGALGLCCLAAPATATPPAALVAPAPAAPPAPVDLAGRIDALLQARFLAAAKVGVVVVDLATGARLYEKNPDLGLNPASNVKLVTTAAALSLLGPEHRYVTRAYVKKGALGDRAIAGDLYLRGGGDPSLVTADLYQLASDLRALGVTKVTGGLVVDNTAFDRDELPPAFDQKDELASYRAPSGAMSVNFGTYVVLARPGDAEGAAALVAVDPPVPMLKLKSTATTAAGARNKLRLAIGPGDDDTIEIAVEGTIGLDTAPVEYRYPIVRPAEYAGEVFRFVLKQRGISLGKPGVQIGAVPKDSEAIGQVRSQPLSVIVRSVNKLSNNYVAENLLKTLDDHAPATFAGGLARVRAWLDGLGTPAPAALRLGNGSGLYDANRISAAQLVHLLVAVHRDFRYGADFLASLPIAGVDGTLRGRMQEGRATRFVRAKTGSLDGVSTLSGYAGAVGRPPLAFAVLFNDLATTDAGRARELQNQLAELLAEEVAARP